MPFGLIIGTDRALALQQAIQDELMTRGYSPEADPVMAEYITIMIINNKTAAQITSELEDFFGSDFDPNFTGWLFKEAARGSIETETTLPEPSVEPSERPAEVASSQTTSHPANDTSRRGSNPPRNGIYQQALSQALPSSSSSQKRPASARSPSPNHPNKMRRTEPPTGPRAMHRDGQLSNNPRSLLDRVGGPAVGGQQDEIQARIDTIVNTGDPNMMMAGGFPGMNGIDMNAMAAGMTNPMMIQELMMNQMALMAHFSGIMNPGQFGGFPMQGVMPQEMGMPQQNMGVNGFQGQSSGPNRGRGTGGRGGRGASRGRGGPPISSATSKFEEVPTESPVISTPIATPTPSTTIKAPMSDATPSAAPSRPAYAVPERPQSPTLCKFGLKCTNAHCRWSHPSPVATAESGVVLSNDPCENGKHCKDKDCIKAHVSPATLKPQDHAAPVPPPQTHSFTPSNPIPCRFGAACARPNCSFAHPQRQSNVQCKFGAACTRSNCLFQHPPGRVLPTAFHQGLSENGPMVTVKNPEPGSMGRPSPHRTATFNHFGAGTGTRDNLEKQMREIEAKKGQAEQAVREAQVAATNVKKEDVKSVPIPA
ncbi:hypothetical protein F5876DRAFT_29674 [Lentinula aff. lateritia]|uniref:Uncharacterized protein n=1 Tax=Lentinula aff. lateritia TaxID=2804960 RepID=A0ACC1UG69_9AGAR|nr:hypothetical protein F5876DRAFT_29674 [Lentinula aff. lateritia]